MRALANDFFEIDVTPAVLKQALERNHEIEFELFNSMYFATPCTNRPLPPRYKILDVSSNKWIFEGDLDAFFAYVFPNGYTLKSNFDDFEFLTIY